MIIDEFEGDLEKQNAFLVSKIDKLNSTACNKHDADLDAIRLRSRRSPLSSLRDCGGINQNLTGESVGP